MGRTFLFTDAFMVALMLCSAYPSEQVSKLNALSELEITSQKLLSYGTEGSHGGDVNPYDPSRNVETAIAPAAEKCSDSDIAISQSSIQRGGIPIYCVESTNKCRTGCSISDIHISCGSFSSATLTNPRIFRWLKINDCLVNDGQPLKIGSTISFTYQTTFQSTLSVASVAC